MVADQPSTFAYGDQIYEPRNYKEEYHGDVTARYALAMSLNNATVKLAEEVGYDKVADLAKAAGIVSVKATPAMALGAYDATPVDMAAAYTVFANGGARISPTVVNSVRNANGDVGAGFQAGNAPGAGSARRLRHDQHDGRRDELRHGLSRSADAASPLPAPERRAARMTAGLPDIPATCCASCGWDMTTTAIFA